MEPELNCSSHCDSGLCLIHPGVNTQEDLEILQRLCTLSTMGVELQRQSLSPVLCAVVWTILSCGILLAFCFLLFTLRFKNNRIVKMSSPNLNVLTLCGSVLTYSSGFLFAFEERAHLQGGGVRAILQARIWMFCIGSTLVFGPILGKTWRLYRVFTQRVPDKRVIIRDIQLMGLVALLILLDMLVLTAWSLTDPVKCALSIGAMVKVVERELSYSLSQLDSCSSLYSDLWVILLAVMKGSLLLYGTYLAGLTSNVSLPPVNQSPTIMTAVSLVTLSTAVAVPVSRFLQAWPNVVYSVVAGAIFICTLATNCMLFVPQLTQWRRFEEEHNNLSQMAKYFSSPSKSVHSVYSQDEVYYLLGENNSMKRLLNEKNAVIDSLQEQVNNAKDKLLRLMSNTHPHEDQEMDSSTTNLHSSSTQTTVVPSDCSPIPLPQRDVAEPTLSSPPFSPPPLSAPPTTSALCTPPSELTSAPLSSPPPPALSFPPGDWVNVKPCSVEFGPYIQGAGMETEAGGRKVEGTVSQQQCGEERSHLPVSPQPSVSSKTGVRTPGEMGGTQTTPSCQSNYVTSSSTLPPVGLAPAQSELSGCHGDTTSPWMAGVRQAGFVSSEQLQEILQELSVDTVMETALRSPNHSRGFRRPSQPSSTNPSVLSPLSLRTPHSPNLPLLFRYPSISPYVMRKRRPPFHSPRGGPPPCYYPGSEPPGWGRRRDTGLSQPDKHSSKTQPLLNPVATETNHLCPDDSDGEEGVEAWHRVTNRCGRRGLRWEHRPPPLRKCPPDGDGGGEGGPGREHGRDSYGYWDSDSSSLADYSYYHRPYCNACLQHGSYPSSDSSSSDSSDSEYGGFTSLCRSTHPVVNFKEDLKPTFV
ncbi:probable G-protein coupled receptor 156 [Salmo trutta]|uniref:G protein-coupled receptor 156 n=1 Tax=Salmo trutta TaxID=8032 RepID=A0A673XJT4_SALTR|nr:probable G-protein coupled receptor 156 [Salmo trutta]